MWKTARANIEKILDEDEVERKTLKNKKDRREAKKYGVVTV